MSQDLPFGSRGLNQAVRHLPQLYGAVTSVAILPGQQALVLLLVPCSSLRPPPAPAPQQGPGFAKRGSQQHPSGAGLTPPRNGLAPPAKAPWHPQDPGKPQGKFILAGSRTWAWSALYSPTFLAYQTGGHTCVTPCRACRLFIHKRQPVSLITLSE